MKTFVIALFYIILLCVFAMFIYYAVTYIGNSQKNFYVQYGELEIRNKAENIELPVNSYSTFYCKNSLGLGAEYTVKIIFAESLEYSIDTQRYSTKALNDISKNFNLVKDKDFFTLYIDKKLTFYDILRAEYPDKQIGYKNIDFYSKDYFTLIVTSANNDKDVISINFHLGV